MTSRRSEEAKASAITRSIQNADFVAGRKVVVGLLAKHTRAVARAEKAEARANRLQELVDGWRHDQRQAQSDTYYPAVLPEDGVPATVTFGGVTEAAEFPESNIAPLPSPPGDFGAKVPERTGAALAVGAAFGVALVFAVWALSLLR